MTTQLDSAVVRIRHSQSAQMLGVGFLVSANQVLTCAHVVAQAVGVPIISPALPAVPVHLDFLLDLWDRNGSPNRKLI